MPKRQGQESQNQRRGGDLDGKRSRPARRRKHLYLILDDWEKGFSVHKIDTDDFDSDSDDDPDAGAAVAGHLPDPPALRLASPGTLTCSSPPLAARSSSLLMHAMDRPLPSSTTPRQQDWLSALPFLRSCNVASASSCLPVK